MIKTNDRYFCDCCTREMSIKEYKRLIKPLDVAFEILKVLLVGITKTGPRKVVCNECHTQFLCWIENRRRWNE